MKNTLVIVLILSTLFGCSTQGGWYNKDDSVHNEFSIVNSALSIVGVAAAVVTASSLAGGGGNSFTNSGYAWDYQPGSGQWVCRNKANGQYAYSSNCNGQPHIDNWP
jgi:hypothetical protein